MTGKEVISCALRGDGGHQAWESRRLSHNREELGKGRAGGRRWVQSSQLVKAQEAHLLPLELRASAG